MKDVLLVDGQRARVRRFREALALFRNTILPLRRETTGAQLRARKMRDWARQNYRTRARLAKETAALQETAIRPAVMLWNGATAREIRTAVADLRPYGKVLRFCLTKPATPQ